MNIAEHIKQLRSCAETNRAEAAELHAEAAKLRGEAEKHQAKADGATAKAHECEEMAAGWDHVADLLENGVAGPAEDIDAPIPFVLAEDAQADFAVGDLVNISDADHKLWGTRGTVVGYVYEPLGVVIEYDFAGSTMTVRPDQLMHHTEFVKRDDEYFDAAEQAAKEAEAVDAEQAEGAAVDAAVEATGHLPGYYDANPFRHSDDHLPGIRGLR